MAVAETSPPWTLTDLLFEKASVGLCLVAPDSTIVRTNAEWLRSTGLTEGEVVGENIIDLFPLTRDMALAMHARARAGHRVEVPRHVQVIHGRESWWEGSIEPVPMEGGTGLLITTRAVSDAIGSAASDLATSIPKTAEGLKDAAERLAQDLDAMMRLHRLSTRFVRAGELPRAVLEEIVDAAISITHADMGNVQLLDPASRRLKVAAYRGHEQWWLDFFESVAEGKGASCGAALQQGTRAIVEDVTTSPVFVGTPALEVQLRAGVRAVQSTPLYGSSGDLVGMLSTHFRAPHRPDERDLRLLDLLARQAADLIERVRSEEALRESEGRYVAIHDKAPIAIALTKLPEGTFVTANDAFVRLFEFTREEVIGRTSLELGISDPGAQALVAEEFRRRGSLRDFEITRRTRSGARIVLSTSLEPVTIGEGKFVLTSIQDITARKQAEEELRKSEQRLRLAQEAARIGAFEWDIQTDVNTWTPELEAIYGLPRGGFQGTETAWEKLVHPDDRAEALRRVQEAFETGAPTESEWRIIWPDGSIHWIAGRWQVLKDGSGQPLRMTGVNMDITERKRAEELRASEAALREADRQKNQFLAMLSHELRNPLAPIRNSLYILERAAPGGEQARRARSVLHRQVGQMTWLIDDLLDVTRITHGKIQLQRERLDLNEVAHRVAEDHRSVFAKSEVRLEVLPAPQEVWINGDRVRLAQVIGNLLQNAAKFTPTGGKATVSVQADAERAQAFLTVRDTGRGIQPDMLPRLFHAFSQAESTLDRSMGGLGLGLALVKGLAELHGGSVSAASEGPGKGAAFTLRLPIDGATARPSTPQGGVAGDGVPRRVLVIEDNSDAADTLREVLELENHVVEVAYSGREGLQKARAFHPDVVLCDIGLPEMDGYDVARAMRADPDLGRVALVAVSGYAQPEDVAIGREAGFDAHLAKPPSIDALERALAEAGRGRQDHPAPPAPG